MRERAGPVTDTEAAVLFGALSEVPALVLAVSGGPDSTALMWLVARWRNGLAHPPRLIAVTVDHGLRPESAAEARAVKSLAKKLDVEHRTLRWTGAKPKTGIQAAAREARYRLLSKAAHESGARHIAVAHTLDDQAETVLFRLARGSGISGLAGMASTSRVPVEEGRDIRLVRPLLAVPKARLIATLDAAGVAYAADPSNDDPRFTRPRLRALLPLLAREGLTAERLGRLAERVARYDDTLWRLVGIAERALWPDPWPAKGPVAVDRKDFLSVSAEIGLRLLARMIAYVGCQDAPELGQLETLYAEMIGARTRLRRTLSGALITLTENKLTVECAPPRRAGAKRRRAAAKSGGAAKTSGPGRKGTFTKARQDDAK